MIQWLKQLENIFAHHNRFQELLIKEESDCETVSTLIENLIDEYNNRFSYYDENLQRLVMLILNILSRNVLQGAVKPFGTNIDEGVHLKISRKSNSKRKDEPWQKFLKEHNRKRIETIFSEIKNPFLRKIHAVTFKGFLLKILILIIDYTFNKLTN